MVKTLVMLRHAHRDTAQRELDNGLSERGREQAKAIRKFFTARFDSKDLGSGLWLVSSPKVRCVETVGPIAKMLNRPVDIHPDLGEQMASEEQKSLSTRVDSFLDEWRDSKAQMTVLCSHGDWLPVACFRLLGLELDIKKGSWLEIEADSGRIRLKWWIPTFKHFQF